MSNEIDWSMINNIVKPNHQYREIKEPPLDHVRMAWPFKTEEELKILSKWFRQEEKKLKRRQIYDHIEKHGEAFL